MKVRIGEDKCQTRHDRVEWTVHQRIAVYEIIVIHSNH